MGWDCPAGCGATVGVDGDGFLVYCDECEKEREGVKQAYLRLALQIVGGEK